MAEVRKARDAYAASLGYDLDRIFADIERLQEERKAGAALLFRFRPSECPSQPGSRAAGSRLYRLTRASRIGT